MMRRDDSGRRRKRQKGHLMAGLMAGVAIMMIFSTLAFQAWVDVLRRDNEAEMIFRAQEIVRAIQRYRRDHGGMGPQKLADLLEPSPNKGFYYIRRLYEDPLVKDGKWGLLYMGAGGAIIDPHADAGQGDGLGPGGGLGGPGSGGTGVRRPSTPGSPGQQLAGSQPQRAGQLGGIGNRDTGEGTGLPIAGVRTLSEDDPFRVYKGLTEYSQWLFTYLDLEQQQIGSKGKGQTGRPGGRLRPKVPGSAPGRQR